MEGNPEVHYKPTCHPTPVFYVSGTQTMVALLQDDIQKSIKIKT